MKEFNVVINNATGLHARPAKTFVKLAKKFDSSVQIQYGEMQVNGKSLIGVLKLGIKHAETIQIRIDGDDEVAAATALREAVLDGLGEGPNHAAPQNNGGMPPAKSPLPVNGHTQNAPEPSAENTLIGISASKGTAIGKTWRYQESELTLSTTYMGASAETNALETAIGNAREELVQLTRDTASATGAETAAIFEAHLELLQDPDLLERTADLIKGGTNAERSWLQATNDSADELAALNDEILSARSADMRDIGQRVLRHLTGQAATELPSEPFVLLAHDLSPSMTATLDKNLVQAICTAAGGPNAHAAILARALGLPAVVAVGDDLLQVADGTHVIVDAALGQINLAPSDAEIKSAETARTAQRQAYEQSLANAHNAAVTTDGHRVEIAANIGGLDDAQAGHKLGAEGVGLLRTEFLFLSRETAPTVAEQTQVYSDILQAMGGHPVIMRTLDVGGDKPLPYIDVPEEENPFLGERGIRLCLNRPELLRDQLTAIAQASKHGKARIMFPMVSDVSELIAARKMLDEVSAEVGNGPIEVGIMIEVPSAALMADAFAPYVDFFSVGTNDLTQYTLAIDRMHPTLSKQADGLHPAVLRLIDTTVRAAKAAGKWVGICGALGADAQAVPILVGLGVAELSVSVPSVPTVKAQVRGLDYAATQQLAQRALACATAQDVRNLS